MEPIIPTYPEITQDLTIGNSESLNLNSPIREILEPELKYSINDLIDVWVRGCTNGATIWQYCQEHNKDLPSSFEFGLELLQLEVRKTEQPAGALKDLTSNNFMLLGLFSELLDIDKK
jgi:hypothetical protein